MKRYLFLLLFLLQFQHLSAQYADDFQARKAAVRFIYDQQNGNYSIASETQIHSDEGVLLCYLYSLFPKGYIAVSADKSFNPIVAYSFVADNTGSKAGNPLLQLIKIDYSNRFKNKSKLRESFVQKNQKTWNSLCNKDIYKTADTIFQQWPPAGTTNTGGWIITKWTQSSPYNSLCPMDLNAGSRSLTGCPATAMAQIINYHKTLNGTRFSNADDYYHNYGSNQFNIDDDYASYDFPSFPQLNLYLDTLENKYQSKASLTTHDMAALSFACGVATKSVYSASGSGTFAISQAYDGFIRMGFNSSQLLDTSVNDQLPLVIDNIKDSLPALLAVVDPSWNSGHNLVFDGYNTNDFFHLNFGWGGSYDGWYHIPSGLPYNLTVFEGIIINIKPPAIQGIKEINENDAALSVFPNPAGDVVQIKFSPYNNGSFRFLLFDSYGRMVSKRLIQAETGKENMVILPLTDIHQGIYSITVTNSSETYSCKLIKL